MSSRFLKLGKEFVQLAHISLVSPMQGRSGWWVIFLTNGKYFEVDAANASELLEIMSTEGK